MILSNRELFNALDSKRLIIRPEPTPRTKTVGTDYCPYDTHAVDLRLAPQLSVPNRDIPFVYNLALPGSLTQLISNTSTRVTTTVDAPFQLMPNRFILGKTMERVELPIDTTGKTLCLAARIEGKSSRARCGLLVHFTARPSILAFVAL